jgi:hypothetical protein
VPNARWVRLFFQSIDDLTECLGFKPLRTVQLKPGGLEVKIWSGFGIQGYGGSSIKKVGNTWSAIAISDPHGTVGEWDAKSQSWRNVEASFTKVENSIDWQPPWEKLEHAGIAEIRDDSEIQHSGVVEDGVGMLWKSRKRITTERLW